MNRSPLVLALTIWVAACASTQVAPPEDKPLRVTGDEVTPFEEAIKPYIRQAQSTYPGAKKRFLAGLPPGYAFYVTALLFDPPNEQGHRNFEQVFVRVLSIKGDQIHGEIASNLNLVKTFQTNAKHTVSEADIRDWTIVDPDGAEEGNFVGKFVDTYRR